MSCDHVDGRRNIQKQKKTKAVATCEAATNQQRPRETKRLADAPVKTHVEGPTCDLVRFPAGQRSEWGVCVYLRRWKHPLSCTSAETKLVQSLSNFSSSSAWSALNSNMSSLTHSLTQSPFSESSQPTAATHITSSTPRHIKTTAGAQQPQHWKQKPSRCVKTTGEDVWSPK